jgi:hypothetical protein
MYYINQLFGNIDLYLCKDGSFRNILCFGMGGSDTKTYKTLKGALAKAAVEDASVVTFSDSGLTVRV